MDPSTDLQTPKTKIKAKLSTNSTRKVNSFFQRIEQPKVSSLNTSNISRKQEKDLSTIVRHQNWRLSDKPFNLLSTIIYGTFVVSPWEQHETTDQFVDTTKTSLDPAKSTDTNRTTQLLVSALPSQSIDKATDPTSCSRSQKDAHILSSTPPLLRKLTEIPPPMLPEVPKLRKSTSSTQSLMSSFFPAAKNSNQREKISECAQTSQRKPAPLSSESTIEVRSNQATLLTNSEIVDPTFCLDGDSSFFNKGPDQITKSIGSKSKLQLTTILSNENQPHVDAIAVVDNSKRSDVLKYLSQSPSIVSLNENKNDSTPTSNASLESDPDVVEFIPSTPELQMWVPETYPGEISHDSNEVSRNPINSPRAFSSSERPFQPPMEIVYDSCSSQPTSQEIPNKRDVNSMSSVKEPKKDSKRKKRDHKSKSIDSVSNSPVGSLLSSTVFEASVAEIERYVDQDLYGYSRLSY